MAESLAIFFASGGAAALSLAIGSEPSGFRWFAFGLSAFGFTVSTVMTRWAARWPRQAFHIPGVVITVLIMVVVLVSPDATTALVAATFTCFVIVGAHVSFAAPVACPHLIFAVGGTTTALLVSGLVPLATVIALDCILAGLGVMTQRLVIKASSASLDPLTGLLNRRGFDNALDELLAEAQRTGGPLSAALIDLDHFKAINDTAGHEAGDRMLCRVAEAWSESLPDGAVLARHGGDEFSVVLPGIPGSAALALIRQVCNRYPDLALSCGVAALRPGETASQFMRRADRALYQAKAAGRGRADLDGAAASGRTGAAPGKAVSPV
jgi:diguanylate cyclase (GGDEF)-like protein